MRTLLAIRCAPSGRMHHLLADAVPPGWRVQTFGPDGAKAWNGQGTSVIVTRDDSLGIEWCHASIARTDRDPSYEDLKWLHAAVFGDGWAYQVFAPPSAHVNIHEHALHLWGRADGSPSLPNFGASGTI